MNKYVCVCLNAFYLAPIKLKINQNHIISFYTMLPREVQTNLLGVHRGQKTVCRVIHHIHQVMKLLKQS